MLEHLHGASMFMPHGHCYLWTPPLLWLMVLSDALIATSYLAIPVMLLHFARKRADMPFQRVLYLFIAFITLCGLTHAWDIYTTWVPAYWVEGVLKAATGLVSLATAITLWPVIPRALALRSPSELEAANQELAKTVAELEAANQQLAESEQLKSRLLENLSHELRTPLTLVKAPTDALLSGSMGEPPDGWESLLRSIQANAGRLEELVQNAFELARLDAGELHPVVHATDVRALFTDVVGDFSRIGGARGVRCEVVEVDVSHPVVMDRYLFERVLFNLLSNGIKFTPAGGAVRCGLRHADGHLVLTVEDDGPGIPADQAAAVFARFHQTDPSRTRTHAGAGLGLALVAEVVALLHGEVSLAPGEGGGARFVVRIPASVATSPVVPQARSVRPSVAAGTPTPERANARGGPDGRLPRVVLAEDNADVAALMVSVLGEAVDVVHHADGRSALAEVHRAAPELVVSDVMMPVLDGLSLCRALKEDPRTRDIPVLLVSARGGREALMEGWSAGADEYLFKPFHPRELLTRVQTLLAAASARRRAIAQLARAELAEAHARETAALTAAISHDVAAPLRIIDQTLALAGEVEDPAARGEIIDAVRSRVRVLQGLTRELLGWLRTGEMDEPVASVELEALVEDARRLVDLPPGFEVDVVGPGPVLRLPPLAVAQCLANLIRNAAQHHDGTHGRVRITAEATAGDARLVVEDDGPGLPPDVRARVFDLFAAGPGGGTGVGLAFVHRVMQRLGGEIALEDAEPRGLRVTMSWPRRVEGGESADGV